jgi:hypothetical protein
MRKVVSFKSFGYRSRHRCTPSFFTSPNLPAHGRFVPNSVRFPVSATPGNSAPKALARTSRSLRDTSSPKKPILQNKYLHAFLYFYRWFISFSKSLSWRNLSGNLRGNISCSCFFLLVTLSKSQIYWLAGILICMIALSFLFALLKAGKDD